MLPAQPQGTAAFFLNMFIDEIIKLTARGNLGRTFCQVTFKQQSVVYWEPILSCLSIRTETDFEALHTD